MGHQLIVCRRCLSPEDVGGTEHPLLRTEGGKTLHPPPPPGASSEVSPGL